MDRFDVIKFDDLTGPKGGEWVRIGGGSFGVVFRGEYLGTEVAIKEVLPNNTYDVEKYFERECVLMKEARHPNIVQYIGLTKSHGSGGRIYIVSEFVGPNLRQYIADKKKAFDWPLRISFATDIARAVAYLHARNCLHRDLKGENLLITDNNRIKVCDFGFARIAARNDEEMRRISYCGTDGYMSPEILMGIDFSLPSDVFSLGVIFCEVISRHLVDPNTFKRQIPTFGLEEDEVREMASDGCPADFIQLCLDMTQVEPADRPDMRHVIRRLRGIEHEIVQREVAKGTLTNIGSLRGSSLAAVLGTKGTKKKNKSTRRIPSFGGQVSTSRVDEMSKMTSAIVEEQQGRSSSESSEEDVEEALRALERLSVGHKQGHNLVAASIRAAETFKAAGHGNPWFDDTTSSFPDLPASWLVRVPKSGSSSTSKTSTRKRFDQKDGSIATSSQAPVASEGAEEEYSTSVVRPSRMVVHPSLASSVSKMTGAALRKEAGSELAPSTMTVVRSKREPLQTAVPNRTSSRLGHEAEVSESQTLKPSVVLMSAAHEREHSDDSAQADETTQSYMTARSGHRAHAHRHRGGEPSLAMATIAASSIYEPASAAVYHRFTLVKNGTRKPSEDGSMGVVAASVSKMPYQLILANALTKCNVCSKRLGFGAYMDCDDCPYKTHVSCAALAEPLCQELSIPGSPMTASPDLSNASSSDSPLQKMRDNGSSDSDETSSNISPLRDAVRKTSAKSPPSSLSKGVALFRKRNSKSPPPRATPTSTPSVVRV